jgi:cytochrome c553
VLKDLKDTLDRKDSAAFAVAYRQTLEACYSCHKAVGRPYLRPMIPTTSPQSIINLDPAASWPQ